MKSDKCMKRSKDWSSAPIWCRKWRLAVANCLRTWVNHFELESMWKLKEWHQIIFPKGEEIEECAISRKNHGYILLGQERRYSCNSLPGKTTVKSDYNCGTIRGLNICFDQLCHTQNVINVAPPWQHQVTLKGVHHWGYHRRWMDSVSAPTIQSWAYAIRFSPVWSFEGHAVFFPGERSLLTNVWTVFKNNCAINSVRVKLRKIFHV